MKRSDDSFKLIKLFLLSVLFAVIMIGLQAPEVFSDIPVLRRIFTISVTTGL